MSADVLLTVLTPDRRYLSVGVGWRRPDGFRVRFWFRPGAGRVGVFLPAGMTGTLPSRVEVHLRGEPIGSGAFVESLRGVMLTVDAHPPDGWCDLVIPANAALRPVSPRSRRNVA
ncbi:hypothetical protein [Deinococcus aquaticus]|uniref:hypothetical protein n=1 Tax=Deinococcus aquaticus TaxID=328692 RepID=UPI003F471899